ncbi:MAG: hypothetical protein M0009_11710 [Deltaproteobacteria bacterium]|nr:hypothetical protein [Deltaproteobacteria bacterium]
MKRNRKDVMRKFVFIVLTLTLLFASGPVFAQGAGATQGQVAMDLAVLLNLNLPPGATQADAISALAAVGIAPAGGWSAGAAADSGFIGALYTSVQAAETAGRVSTGTLGSASAVVAYAATQAGISGTMAVNAIVGAGGNQSQANTGAASGSAVFGYSPAGGGAGAGGTGFGPGTGGGPGGGGGGGGVNPSPSR